MEISNTVLEWKKKERERERKKKKEKERNKRKKERERKREKGKKKKKKKRRTPVCTGGKRKKDEISVDCLDFNKKILHTAWHPSENVVAVAATNNLFLFQDKL
ncbi:hypothetical protein HZH68_005976 [Vespula germanica]|uniref:Uncharacterized protein n=1 Tax=Vespula germanica TaxID=30212 RepID=A0A834KC20_VESGE|nr:hypothetical protein HZH68_005976 [Vespula germanica]